MNNSSLLKGNTIELHYWFHENDLSHSIDAIIQNKCEFELLQIIKEFTTSFGHELIIETEPFGEGGFRSWLKIVSKEENKKAVITTALVISFATTVLFTPITTALSIATSHIIEKIFEDEELQNLQDEKLREEIKNLKLDAELKQLQLSQNNILIKRRSNFFEALDKYPKVEKISLTIENTEKEIIISEKFIANSEFKNFILVSDKLKPLKIENALIEIISPVLKKGNYKWRGIYNGESIPFTMKSIEFKNLVQSGVIEFKNGFSINCNLEIERKLNNNGEEILVNYNIVTVIKYFINDKPIETQEGAKIRKQNEADKLQTKIQFPDFHE